MDDNNITRLLLESHRENRIEIKPGEEGDPMPDYRFVDGEGSDEWRSKGVRDERIRLGLHSISRQTLPKQCIALDIRKGGPDRKNRKSRLHRNNPGIIFAECVHPVTFSR